MPSNSPRPSLPSRRLAEAQSQWLQSARSRLLRRSNIARRQSIVDLGAGWGQVSIELQQRSGGHVFAIDRQKGVRSLLPERPEGCFAQKTPDPFLPAERPEGCFAQKTPDPFLPVGQIEPIIADGHRLPLADDSCDLVFCQCMLMWADDPLGVVRESLRVLRPGGAFSAIEPDYGGLMEYPDEVALKPVWVDALRRAGADPFLGRKLPHFLTALDRPFEVQFFDRLEPACDARFDLLLELSLTSDERQRVESAKEASHSAGSIPVAHLPFWMVYSEA